MIRTLRLITLLSVMLTVSRLQAGDVVERIVATVGKRAILQSELERTVQYEMFTAGRSLESVTTYDLKSALERIIDQQLIHGDIGPAEAFTPTDEDVRKQVAEVRRQILGAANDEGWRRALQQNGLTEAIVRERVRAQLETMRIVNSRLRPGIRVEQAEVEAAYRQEYLPKLRQAGAKELPLSDVSQRIRQILVERRIGENLEKWIEALRSQADIHIVSEELRADENRGSADSRKGPEPRTK